MHYDVLKLLNPNPGVLWHGEFEDGFVEANRRLYNHEFVFVSKGTGRVIIEGQVFNCGPGTVLIIPPDTVHCTIADSLLERWCLHFDWVADKTVPELPYEYSDTFVDFDISKCNMPPEWLPFKLPLVRMVSDYDEMNLLVRKLFAAGSRKLERAILQKGLFLQILSLIISEKTAAESHISPILLKAKEFIDINYRKTELTVSSAAAKVSVTSNHLCRIFRKELGISPLDYINSLRLKYACRLLKNSSLNVGQIAVESGFNDNNYFARIFKKKLGVSPSKYFGEI